MGLGFRVFRKALQGFAGLGIGFQGLFFCCSGAHEPGQQVGAWVFLYLGIRIHVVCVTIRHLVISWELRLREDVLRGATVYVAYSGRVTRSKNRNRRPYKPYKPYKPCKPHKPKKPYNPYTPYKPYKPYKP